MSNNNFSTKSTDRATTDAIKAKIDLVDLVSERVELKTSGQSLRGLCPFHEDHEPSFNIYPGTKRFKCFGCDARGDIFQWVQLTEHLDFPAALKLLADRAGVELPKPPTRKTAQKVVANYDYTDESGNLRFQVVRYEPKDFRQRRPGEKGRWIWNLEGVDRPLFRLPEVLQAVESGADIWITEGEKDALALVEAGVCATTAAGGAKAPWLDAYTEVLRTASAVIIVADADDPGYRRAQVVRDALDAVGIPVRVVRAKEGKDAADHLAAGIGIDDFVEILKDDLDALVGQSVESDTLRFPGKIRTTWGHRYAATSEGLFMLETDKDGNEYAAQLTNFDIEIVEGIRELNAPGEETGRYRVAVRCQGHIAEFDADAVTLSRISELTNRAYIGEPTITPGKAPYVLHAMHMLSQSIKHRVVYRHLGWSEIDGRWIFLHGLGAIGPGGSESGVSVVSPIEGYGLPDPASGASLASAIEATLQTWQISRKVMTPLLGAIWRAVLPVPALTGLHLVGRTGVGKTTAAQLAVSHFGTEPALTAWTSTANAIEVTAWLAANHAIVVDDFNSGGERDRAEMEASFDRVFRGAGNGQGRSRLNRDSTLQSSRPPRALIISTGEDIPGEARPSGRARAIFVEVGPEDVPVRPEADPKRKAQLSAIQEMGEEGILAAGLAAYVTNLTEWISEDGMHLVRKAIKGSVARWASRWVGQTEHGRTARAIANLAVGWELWLNWVEAADVLSADQVKEITVQIEEDLAALVKAQSVHLQVADHGTRWINLLVSALRSGRCHVAWRVPPNFGCSAPGETWGWRNGEPKGDQVGWIDTDGVYLLPDATHAVICDIARRSGVGWGLSQQQTWRLLSERGWLLGADRGHLTHRVRVGNDRLRLIHIAGDLLTEQDHPAEPGKNSESIPDSIALSPVVSPAFGDSF